MTRRIHFVGIGGAGLSALARVMLARGEQVSGSDLVPNRMTEELARAGAQIFSGHAAENVAGADVVVITSAARAENPELVAAQAAGIPVLKRREFLREVTKGFDTIAVAGSHGKTTTTAMIALVLTAGDLDPTVVVGGAVPGWNTNARAGHSRWFVIEADEYDYAFLGLEPAITVVTNVDYDHPDLFATRQVYQQAFEHFMAQTRADGAIVVCGEQAEATQLALASGRPLVRYGVNDSDDWRAEQIRRNDQGGMNFDVVRDGRRMASLSLQVPGEHNVLNALAALAASARVGVPIEVTCRTLGAFQGVGRRFEVRGMFRGAWVIDDYAHHPAEIRATLRAARLRYPGAQIWALFQPHTYTRTRQLLREFANAFDAADHVIITEIYPAREQNTLGVSGQELVGQMGHSDVRFLPTLDEAASYLQAQLRPGDVLLMMGAGDVNRVAQCLSEHGNA